MDASLKTQKSSLIELVTFYIAETICGLYIQDVQEINLLLAITAVPQAPSYLRGILNLRGQIITVLDLSEKLGLGVTEEDKQNRIVIVQDKGEASGLLVSRMGDVVIAERAKIEQAPANIGAIQAGFFEGVINANGAIIGILNLERVLAD
jgi:purine-binding chemotaxis protein CheW